MNQASAQDLMYMQHALGLAARAEAQGEVPVGALAVLNGEIIGEGWNRPISSHDPTAHAEIVALRAAALRLGNYRLTGATLYATLEPCPMCAGAIVQARIPTVIYGADDPKAGACRTLYTITDDPRLNHRATVIGGVLQHDCAQLLKEFFALQRSRGKK